MHSVFLEKKSKKKLSVICIGHGGGDLVLFASIMCRGRAAGRNGGGAVMGAKSILGISVSGKAQPKHADAKGFMAATREATKTIKNIEMRDGFNEF
jgi:aldehyde:ferredoxin oxidoreductase